MLDSITCRQEHFRSDWFQSWKRKFDFAPLVGCSLHRKEWEFCAIAQALRERHFLQAGMSGLGFAVGKEPLVSMFASFGCKIEATDLAQDGDGSERWMNSNQHAASLDSLFLPHLIDREAFDDRVSFHPADMRDLSQLPQGNYDFIWSSCAFEHLGSLELGMKFVFEAMGLLKPGGIAVHTTEINVGSNDETIETGHDVIYRQKDIEELDRKLRRNGMAFERLDLFPGTGIHDRQFDVAPWATTGREHVKLQLYGHVCTSQLLIAYR